jgi:hypothetical protein
MSTISERLTTLNNRTREGLGEYLAGWKPWRNPLLYLALLLAPAGIATVIFYADHQSALMTATQLRGHLEHIPTFCEAIAPWVLVATTAVFLFKASLLRSPTYLVIGVMAACLTWREFHWTHASKVMIYPLLGVCLAWAIVWWRKLDRPAENPWLSLFLFTALATYGLAQFVEKGLFDFLPNEDTLHTQWEEITEVTAHSLLLLSAIFSSWRRPSPSAEPQTGSA